MKTLDLNELQTLRNAIDDIIGYLTDTSCGDPECCGGPFYTKEDYDAGVLLMEQYGLISSE